MITLEFETVCCCTCGIVYQIPEEFQEMLQESGQIFYCPNGHEQHYSEADDLRVETAEAAVIDLQVQVRQLKCDLLKADIELEKALGVSMWKRVRIWLGRLKP